MKYSQFRIAILTCIFGIVSVPFLNGSYEKWSEPFVDLPQVISDTPITIRVCPEPLSKEAEEKFYREHGYIPVRQTSGINCNQGGGGGSGGRDVFTAPPKKQSLKSCWL